MPWDVRMYLLGLINLKKLSPLGIRVSCLLGDSGVSGFP